MTERDAREKAALRVLIYGLPNSPGGVGPVMRLIEKRRVVLERWEQRRIARASKAEEPDEFLQGTSYQKEVACL